MKNKKAQGLSINTIIIAAIAILVLVLLVLIFTGKLGDSRQQLTSCSNNGGRCVLPSQESCDGSYQKNMGRLFSDCQTMSENLGTGENYICCVET